MNELIVLTDRRQARGRLPEVLRAAVAGGARTVLLREKDLPRDRREELAEEVRAALRPVHGQLIVAGPDPLGGDAVHLAASDPTPAPDLSLVGRSCHNEAEIARLTTEDYVTVSPVFSSNSKPGYGPELGPDGLRHLVTRTPVRVFALGGVETAAQARACRDAGAAGVAVMGAVMRAPDPEALVSALVEGLAR